MDNPNGGMGGKTVLITGGTSGIGKATAVAAMGANVVITGRNAERGESAVEEIREQSHNDYFSDRKEIEAKEIVYDPDGRRRLWEISEDMTGLKVAA